ncbi:MAG: hypothetical protein CL868_19935 [Cytophagaceae bacterium]|nr:hypothetical protein [Cytophagaceae bacterium]
MNIFYLFFLVFPVFHTCSSNESNIVRDIKVVNILDYGVSINNASDDDAIIISKVSKELSATGGGVIFFPNGTYHLKSPIWGYSNIEFRGESKENTILKNINTKRHAASYVFACGWFHERDYDYVKLYPVRKKKGDNGVVLENLGELSNFQKGDIVILRLATSKRKENDNLQTSPYAEILKIQEVTQSTGFIEFEDEIQGDLDVNNAGLSLTKLEEGTYNGNKTYLTKNVHINNFTVYSQIGTWMSRDAVYNGIFENITVLKSNTLLGGNGKKNCVFKNIDGTFNTRFIEFAEGSSNNVMNNIHGVAERQKTVGRKKPLMVLKYGDSLSNFSINNESGLIPSMILRCTGNMYIGNGKINTPLQGSVFLVKGKKNRIENVDVEIDKESKKLGYIIKEINSSSGDTEIQLKNSSISGVFKKRLIDEKIKPKSNTIIGNKFYLNGGKPKDVNSFLRTGNNEVLRKLKTTEQ